MTTEVKEAFARPFSPTCVYSDGTTRWADLLPKNVVRDFRGRSTR